MHSLLKLTKYEIFLDTPLPFYIFMYVCVSVRMMRDHLIMLIMSFHIKKIENRKSFNTYIFYFLNFISWKCRFVLG